MYYRASWKWLLGVRLSSFRVELSGQLMYTISFLPFFGIKWIFLSRDCRSVHGLELSHYWYSKFDFLVAGHECDNCHSPCLKHASKWRMSLCKLTFETPVLKLSIHSTTCILTGGKHYPCLWICFYFRDRQGIWRFWWGIWSNSCCHKCRRSCRQWSSRYISSHKRSPSLSQSLQDMLLQQCCKYTTPSCWWTAIVFIQCLRHHAEFPTSATSQYLLVDKMHWCPVSSWEGIKKANKAA